MESPKSYSTSFREDWPISELTWEKNSMLNNCVGVAKPDDTNVTTIISNSRSHPIDFPVQSARCEYLRTDPKVLTSHANSAYPVIHEYVLKLIESFLNVKRKYGSAVERELYENLTITGFVHRMLEKRAVMFCGGTDKWMLLDGKRGFGKWNTIGSDSEKAPLVLRDYLSYDELKISALLSVSSYSEFINPGSRQNSGVPSTGMQTPGVIIGLIGPRLERIDAVEFQEIVIHPKQNTIENGYGISDNDRCKFRRMISEFYEEPNFLYDDVSKLKNNCRFVKIGDAFFDRIYYKKRLTLSLDTLLLEANARAKDAVTTAFVHVVGIGLGEWRMAPQQDSLFLDVLAQRITALLPALQNVSDIALAYFNASSCGPYKDGEIIPCASHSLGGIKVLFTKRDPHRKLSGADSEKLLVVSYAWDGNALPGNEYWVGALCSSGDPAAAASSQVAEMHNSHINTAKVQGSNLHVASRKYGILHINDYAKKVFGSI